MAITAAQVAELRQATGAGMMDCKKALQETGGDMEEAKDFLRKKGVAVAQKKAARETNEGGIAIKVDDAGKRAAMVQLACETDFVARNENFQALLGRLVEQALAQGGDDFANQPAVGAQGTVNELLTESIATMGENLQVLEAVRLELGGEGRIAGYVHSNSKIGVLVAIGSDKAVAADALDALAHDIAMHVAASQVSAVSEAELDPAVVEKEREILLAQAQESGKPPEIAEKMVQGRLKKFVKEVTLLEQPFVKNPDQTVSQLVQETGKALGAELTVERFVKLQF